jgi:hypothetical protein
MGLEQCYYNPGGRSCKFDCVMYYSPSLFIFCLSHLACPARYPVGSHTDRQLSSAFLSTQLFTIHRQGTGCLLVLLWVPRDSTPVVNWSHCTEQTLVSTGSSHALNKRGWLHAHNDRGFIDQFGGPGAYSLAEMFLLYILQHPMGLFIKKVYICTQSKEHEMEFM